MHHDDELVAELRARIGSLERRLDEAQAERGRLQDAHGADRDYWHALLEVERERVDRLLAALAAERAPTLLPRPARRPWPGLRAWWRRLIEGEGG